VSRSVEGVIALNLLFVAAGLSMIWATRGIHGLLELAQMAAPALLLGAACIGVLGTFRIYEGDGLSIVAVLALAGSVVLGALAFGTLRRLTAPAARTHGLPPQRYGPAWPAWALAAVCCVFTVLLLALAGAQPMAHDDGSSLWVTRAAAISFARERASLAFNPTAAHTTQPLLVPALQSMDFAFARSVDPASLSLEYWVLYVGFLLTVVVLVRGLVPDWLIYLSLSGSLFAPQVEASLISAQSDLPLAIFFASAALFLAVWLRVPAPWLLVAFAVTLAATLATNVHGQLLAACLTAGGVIALADERGWRWLRAAAAAAAAFVSVVPFLLWAHHHHLKGAILPLIPGATAGAATGWHGLAAATELLFAYHLWLIAVPVALGTSAALVLLGRRSRAVAKLVLGTIVLTGLGLALRLVAYGQAHGASLPVSSARGIGEAIALFSAALTPLLVTPLLPRSLTARRTRAHDGAPGSEPGSGTGGAPRTGDGQPPSPPLPGGGQGTSGRPISQ
jgi:hypothetical protein